MCVHCVVLVPGVPDGGAWNYSSTNLPAAPRQDSCERRPHVLPLSHSLRLYCRRARHHQQHATKRVNEAKRSGSSPGVTGVLNMVAAGRHVYAIRLSLALHTKWKKVSALCPCVGRCVLVRELATTKREDGESDMVSMGVGVGTWTVRGGARTNPHRGAWFVVQGGVVMMVIVRVVVRYDISA